MSTPSPTIVIVACEESGDNYGALLARELLAARPGVKLAGVGGPRMAAAGVELIENMLEHSATGLMEVASSAGFFLRTMRRVVELARERRAGVAVLIDSPDFNLRIAGSLRAAGTRVAYYVSPQLWAWRAGRVRNIQRDVDEMLVIFPFEAGWYARYGVDAAFVGHPMLDLIDLSAVRAAGEGLRKELGASERAASPASANEQASAAHVRSATAAPLLGLLPGSRRNEVTRLLPRFLQAARLLRERRPDLRVALGCARWLTPERAGDFLRGFEDMDVRVLHGRTHELMAASDLLLACSGTATLEAGLIGTPLVMAYRLSWPTWLLAHLVIAPRQFFCMPNILLGREVVPEMIQFQTDPVTLALCCDDMLQPERNASARRALAPLPHVLGGPGASARAARHVLDLME